MQEYEKLLITELIAKINLDKYRKQFGNTYVYGADDVLRLLCNEQNKLELFITSKTNE